MEQIPKTQNGEPLYTLVKDGHNVEHKVINFNNSDVVKNKGLIVIEIIRKGQTRHTPSSTFRLFRDPITEIVWGVPQGLNQQKDIRFQSFEWSDIRQYDLSIAQDRKEWAVMQYHPSLADSPYAKGKPAFRKLDVEKDAETKVVKVKAKRAAYDILDGLSHLQMIDMARDCGGIDTKNSSMAVIQANLGDFIENKPEDFNRIWTMVNRPSLTVFKRCLLTGLVHLDLNQGYMWKKATALGNSEAMAIDYITKNHSLLMTMDTESKLLDKEFEMIATDAEKTAYITNQPLGRHDDEDYVKKNQDIDRLMKANAQQAIDMKVLMELLAKKNPAEMLTKDLNFADSLPELPLTPVLTPEEAAEKKEFEELRELQKYANGLGMKHSYVTKDKNKINEWIEQKKKETATT